MDYSCHPITQQLYINLVENCRLDFSNSDVGYCLGHHPHEVLSEQCQIGSLPQLLYLHRYSSKSTFGRREGSVTEISSSKRRKTDLCPL